MCRLSFQTQGQNKDFGLISFLSDSLSIQPKINSPKWSTYLNWGEKKKIDSSFNIYLTRHLHNSAKNGVIKSTLRLSIISLENHILNGVLRVILQEVKMFDISSQKIN